MSQADLPDILCFWMPCAILLLNFILQLDAHRIGGENSSSNLLVILPSISLTLADAFLNSLFQRHLKVHIPFQKAD